MLYGRYLQQQICVQWPLIFTVVWYDHEPYGHKWKFSQMGDDQSHKLENTKSRMDQSLKVENTDMLRSMAISKTSDDIATT